MKRKREERRKRRKLKFRTLFMLSLTLIFNTYAWFLYITTVSTNMTVHVDAWSVNFEVDSQVIEKEFLMEIDEAYPGMTAVEKTITVTNSGEKNADLSYVISSIRILDNTYIIESELTTDEKAALTGSEISTTTDEITRMLNEDYPFQITVTCSATELNIGEEATVTVNFSWDYDSNNDELDTQFGVDSYKYYQANQGKPAIEAKIKIKAQQKTD